MSKGYQARRPAPAGLDIVQQAPARKYFGWLWVSTNRRDKATGGVETRLGGRQQVRRLADRRYAVTLTSTAPSAMSCRSRFMVTTFRWR